jgi:hypothetical protein
MSATEPTGQIQVFTNNVGYDPAGPKRFVIGAASGAEPIGFQVLDTTTGAVAYRGTARFAGGVDDWTADGFPAVPPCYWVGDFSPLSRQGQYVIAVPTPAGSAPFSGVSYPFLVEPDVFERHAMCHLIHYFKGSRCSGQFDKVDAHLRVGEHGTSYVSVPGGWYDASGDFGIHFSQVFRGPAAPYLITLSVPLTAWALTASYNELLSRGDTELTQLCNWTLDEALFGADFLVRMKAPDGSFYFSIYQPEGDSAEQPEPPGRRFLEATETATGYEPVQVSFREGGGTAIAALAAASTYSLSGDFTSADYLRTAEEAFAYLQASNVELNGGLPENILDECEILLAATELYKATRKQDYLAEAQKRAGQLADRLVSWHQYRNYWRADSGTRPFFHPSNAGLPVVSLLNYLPFGGAAEQAALHQVVRKSLEFEIATTREVTNPFGYARQLVQNEDGTRYTTFFFPHDVSPSVQAGGWWQGENARIASLAAAARLAAASTPDGDFAARLEEYARDQVNWICGLNPYASCMLNGSGLNNPAYYDVAGTWQFLPTAGGINNGICGKTTSGGGILYDRGYRSDEFQSDWPEDWRRMEQWLPHSTWFMYALAIGGGGSAP